MGIATPPPYENVVNTPLPTVIQQETTAATDTARQAMGILPSTTFQSFTDYNKQDLWKYNSASSHPTLAPLSKTRTAGAEEIEDMGWLSIASSIMAELSKDVQDKLAALHKLTPEQRNDAYFDNYESWRALDELIKFAGKTEYFITYASELSRSENLTNEALFNSKFPSIVTENMVKSAQELAEMLKEELRDRLLNHPEKDACTYLLSQFESLIHDLSQIERAA